MKKPVNVADLTLARVRLSEELKMTPEDHPGFLNTKGDYHLAALAEEEGLNDISGPHNDKNQCYVRLRCISHAFLAHTAHAIHIERTEPDSEKAKNHRKAASLAQQAELAYRNGDRTEGDKLFNQINACLQPEPTLESLATMEAAIAEPGSNVVTLQPRGNGPQNR